MLTLKKKKRKISYQQPKFTTKEIRKQTNKQTKKNN